MANLNIDAFSEEYRNIAPKECACFLVECLSEKEKTKLKEDWDKAGGHKVIPWWKWCLENIEVKYQNIEKIPTTYDIDNVVNELKQAIQNGTIKIEVGNSKLFEIINQGNVSKDVCEWEYDKHFEFAKSKCGSIDTHRIEFNKLKYCPYCGKPIKIIN